MKWHVKRRSPFTNALLRAAFCSIFSLTTVALNPNTALAQNNAGAAQALYDQATAEMDGGKYESACKKLEEVIRLIPEGLGAKFTLAQCYEGSGKLASAWSQYAAVESMARTAKQMDRAKKAGAKATALKKKLAVLTVDVPAAMKTIPSFAITRDNVEVGEAQWGTPVPVDKGSHTIVASAPGYEPWTSTVTIPNDGAKQTITIPELKKEPPKPVVALSTAKPTSAPTAPLSPEPKRPWQAPLGITVLALGVAGLGVGGVFGGLALSKRDESITVGCNVANECTPAAAKIRDEARLYGTVSTISLAVGGGVALTGLLVWVLAPRAKQEASSPGGGHTESKRLPSETTASVVVGPGFYGISLKGAF